MAAVPGEVDRAGPAPDRPLRVGYVLRSFPRLSQTFVLRELLGLEALGVDVVVFAATNPEEPLVQAELASLTAPVVYLSRSGGWVRALRDHAEVAATHPVRYLWAWAHVARGRAIDRGYTASSRWRCLAQGIRLARALQRGHVGGVDHLHAHFAHDPALVALIAGRITGTPFSFTAHARDIYQLAPPVLAARIARAAAVVTICTANLDYLVRIAGPHVTNLVLIYNGVDLAEYPPRGRPPSNAPPHVVTVGRFVEKKGFVDLLEALARVKASGRAFTCEIVGDGPLQSAIEAAVTRLNLAKEVTLGGSRTQAEIRHALADADIFAITPYVTDDGDRDGVPTVILEAMASGLPVVSTRVVGVGEAVAHGRTGLLADPRDIAGICAHLATLIDDPDRRRAMGIEARREVAARFDIREGVRTLLDVFSRSSRAAPGAGATHPT